jgi:hypothetical protein
VKKAVLTVLLGLAAVSAVGFAAPAASADENEYLSALSEGGIDYKDSAAAVNLGKSVCDSFRQGKALTALVTIRLSGYAPSIAKSNVVLGATAMLCPDMAGNILTAISWPVEGRG